MKDDRPRSAPGNPPAPPGASAGDAASEAPTHLPASDGEGGRIRIGDYLLRERIGGGGMGEVFRAEQLAPVRRTVALKLIRAGMYGKEAVARFESERQALALMSHTNIARVYDAGVATDDRPYLAMEYVEGRSVTDYCDACRLGTRERLEIFIQICEGVLHAHQKGIIHRDIKPSNVLVAVEDDRPVPKIIDFGVAKATGRRLTDKTMHTRMGTVLGTPEYMSPEQAERAGADVDTRTDIYSLGVLLYNLLVGALPFDPEGLRYDEVIRRICTDEPSRPSVRLSQLGPVSAEVSKRRNAELPHLVKQLRGDLDWITLKALEKDRSRRYASAGDLAADIRRHLNHEPIVARPPSTVYRMGKFVRRHTAGVATAALGVVLLVGFAVTMAIQAGRIARERDRANLEAAAATQVAGFLTELFSVADPGNARGSEVTARELLDRGAESIRRRLDEQPLIRARLMTTIGDVYRQLGLLDESALLLDEALATRRRLLGAAHAETLQGAAQLARTFIGQGRYDEAERLLLDAVPALRRTLGSRHFSTRAAANSLAQTYFRQGRHDEAEVLYRELIAGGGSDEDLPLRLTVKHNLAALHLERGRLREAEPLLVEALEGRRALYGDDHPFTLSTMSNLATLNVELGRVDEAERLLTRILEIRERVLGADHPRYGIALHNLANLRRDSGRHDSAAALYERAGRVFEARLGRSHPYVAENLEHQARLLRLLGREGEAGKLEDRAAVIRRGPPAARTSDP